MTDDLPKTLVDAVRYFSDREVCHAFMRKIKWPDGVVTCPKCGTDRVKEMPTRPGKLKCNRKECQTQFSYKVGTIFESSPLGLDKWFVAVWSIANCKNGISSHELARALGVTQKTAWFMLHRIREAMKTGTFRKLGGEVEADETFVGGEAKNMHAHKRAAKIKGRGAVGKVAVQGLLERGGPVMTRVIGATDGRTLRRMVAVNVEPNSRVYTDKASGYSGLALRYVHSTIDHSREYVRGRVHTNGLENFWSLFKRSVRGTWTHLAPFHVHRYATEQGWRYNNREHGDGSRFERLLAGVVGRRLTYRELCGIDDAGFMGLT